MADLPAALFWGIGEPGAFSEGAEAGWDPIFLAGLLLLLLSPSLLLRAELSSLLIASSCKREDILRAKRLRSSGSSMSAEREMREERESSCSLLEARHDIFRTNRRLSLALLSLCIAHIGFRRDCLRPPPVLRKERLRE